MSVAFGGNASGWKTKNKFNYKNALNEIVLAISGRMNVSGFVI